MKFSEFLKFSGLLLFFSVTVNEAMCQGSYASDSLILLNMVQNRQVAMKRKDVPAMLKQFSDDATFINPSGYFYENKAEIEAYHNTLTHLDTITYYYSTGSVELRMLDANNALIYYPWRMDWYNIAHPADTLYQEFGLFTITAQKRNTTWYWIAVTDQHTPEFFDDLYEHKGITPKKQQKTNVITRK
jgi:hypothetical protein